MHQFCCVCWNIVTVRFAVDALTVIKNLAELFHALEGTNIDSERWAMYSRIAGLNNVDLTVECKLGSYTAATCSEQAAPHGTNNSAALLYLLTFLASDDVSMHD